MICNIAQNQLEVKKEERSKAHKIKPLGETFILKGAI